MLFAKKFSLSAILLMLLIIACGSLQKVIITRSDSAGTNENKQAYPDLFTALRYLDFEYIRQNTTDRTIIDLSEAFREVSIGKIDSGTDRLMEIYEKIEDKKQRIFVMNSIVEFLIYQERWNKALEFINTSGYEGTYKLANFEDESPKDPPEKYHLPQAPYSIPYRPSINGTPIVEVFVNGHPYRFWIDTGASITVITSDVALKTGIDIGNKKPIIGGGGTSKTFDVYPAIIKTFKIGGMSIDNHRIAVTDKKNLALRFFGITLMQIDGIIGWPVISKLKFDIDFSKKIITLDAPREKETTDRNLFWMTCPIVRLASKDFKNHFFFLDIGGKTSFYENLFNRMQFQNITVKNKTLYSAGGKEKYKMAKIPQATFFLDRYQITFKDVLTHPHPADEEPFLIMDGQVGNEIALGGKMSIDYLNGRFDIEIADSEKGD